MRNWLLLFTIGPVQSFIENSRKMRDLYAGSFLLSHLILCIYNKIEQKSIENIDLQISLPAKAATVPNRILLKIIFKDTDNENVMRKWIDNFAKELEIHVHTRFKEICTTIFRKLSITANTSVWNQLSLFPETYWVYLQCSDEPSNDYRQIIYKLQATKSLHIFAPCEETAGRKCALFPEYNALFYRRYKNGKKPNYITQSAEELSNKITYAIIKPGESLSAIALIKRTMYKVSESLPNYDSEIISVAAMLLKNSLPKDTGIPLFNKISANTSESVFNLQNNITLSDEEYNEADKKAAKDLFAYMNKNNIKVNPYYAIIKLDGDNIGTIYQQCSVKEQSILSNKIKEFAEKVPKIMKKYNGMCIYAGGEDFLCFCPAKRMISTLLNLRCEFYNTFQNTLQAQPNLTFSAGIVITHLMTPLKNMLLLTNEMECYAKNNDGKNSFAIAVVKRSGKYTYIRNKFGEFSKNLSMLNNLAENIQTNRLSNIKIYKLISILQELCTKGNNIEKDMIHMLIFQNICQFYQSTKLDKQNAYNIIELYENYNDTLKVLVFMGRE